MFTKPVRQKILLCKSLILIYFFVVAILPLSNIHVAYLGDKIAKKLDQARTSSSTWVKGKLSINIFRTNPVAKLNHLKYQDSMEALLLFSHQTAMHICSQSNMEKMLRGFPYLYSGLSPPFV